MVRATAESQNEREQNYTDDGDDFEGGKPEFEFTKEFDTEVVDNADDDKEYSDKDTRIDCISIDPILNDEGSSGKLVGRDDDVFEPIPERCQL
jgi:hypothetical protein